VVQKLGGLGGSSPKTTTPSTTTPKTTTPKTTTCDSAARTCPSNKALILFGGKCMTPQQYGTLNVANIKAHNCVAGQYYNICTKKCAAQPGVKLAKAYNTNIRMTLA